MVLQCQMCTRFEEQFGVFDIQSVTARKVSFSFGCDVPSVVASVCDILHPLKLSHCLREIIRDCKASRSGVDLVCTKRYRVRNDCPDFVLRQTMQLARFKRPLGDWLAVL